MPELSDEEIARTEFGTYTADQFFDDMERVTEYRTDPGLCELLVRRSYDTILWMRAKGLRFQPAYGRQAFKVDGRFTLKVRAVVLAAGGFEANSEWRARYLGPGWDLARGTRFNTGDGIRMALEVVAK